MNVEILRKKIAAMNQQQKPSAATLEEKPTIHENVCQILNKIHIWNSWSGAD